MLFFLSLFFYIIYHDLHYQKVQIHITWHIVQSLYSKYQLKRRHIFFRKAFQVKHNMANRKELIIIYCYNYLIQNLLFLEYYFYLLINFRVLNLDELYHFCVNFLTHLSIDKNNMPPLFLLSILHLLYVQIIHLFHNIPLLCIYFQNR